MNKQLKLKVSSLGGNIVMDLMELGEYLSDGLIIKAVKTAGPDFVAVYHDGETVAVEGGAAYRADILASIERAVKTVNKRN